MQCVRTYTISVMAGSKPYKRARDGSAAKSPSKRRRTNARSGRRGTTSTFPVEMKFFDTSFSQTVASNADWTGTEVPCTNYMKSDGTTLDTYTDSALIPSAVGAGYGQIIGSKYMLRALRVRGTLIPTVVQDQADVLSARFVTLCLVLDTQPNGQQAQGEEIFYDMGSAIQNNDSFQAMGGGAAGRYQILARKTFTIQPAVAVADGASTNSAAHSGNRFEFTKQWKRGLKVCIKSNSAVPIMASLTDNSIFMLAHCVSGSPAVVIAGVARAYYMD